MVWCGVVWYGVVVAVWSWWCGHGGLVMVVWCGGGCDDGGSQVIVVVLNTFDIPAVDS